MKIDFTNKTALVVGGSAGIGLKIKEEFQNLGSNVLSISRKEGVDINDTKQVDEFLLQVDRVDFLINVASINYTKKIQEIDLNEWQEVINTNLNSIFYVTKQCIEKMDSGSKIVNFSSRTTPRMFASSFGNFLVILFSSILIKGHFLFTSISSKRILLSANGTLSIAPGASNFLCIDLAISTSGEIITSIGRFSLLYTKENLGFK